MNSLYFVAIIPPQPLCGKITAVKQDFRERFHSSHALRLVPHITLKAPFSFPDEKKPEVLDWFAQLPVPAAAFRQKLSGFDCFRSKRNPVIFIVPELNEHLRQMQRDIVNSFRSFFPSISLTDKELEFHPHITVAYRDLDYRIFREAWEEYREKNFDADFEVDNFSLLQHDQKQWNIIATRVLE